MNNEMITMADACCALIKNEESTPLTSTEKDYLNRAEFVDNVFNIIQHLSDNNSCTTFAIDGVWGCGKSFVLDMLQEKLFDEQDPDPEKACDRYVVFHYNSWKYDYYDEPLIAIVSAILDSIERNKFISADLKEKVRKTIGVLASVGGIFCKVGWGIDPVEEFKKISKEWRSETNEQAIYDPYYAFKKVLKELKETLADISKDQTVVIIVDELDRCLPEYSIKVMERLHHLTEDMENIIVVMAIDKEQLKESVKKAFGFEKTELYLRKFIQFEIGLNSGDLEGKFLWNYLEYIDQFDDIEKYKSSIEEFIKAIFSRIDNRRRQQLVEKTAVIHQMLFSKKGKKHCSFMCVELLLMVLCDYYEDYSIEFCRTFNNDHLNAPLSICAKSNNSCIVFSSELSDYFKKISERIRITGGKYLVGALDEIILYYWISIHNYRIYKKAYTDGSSLRNSGIYCGLINCQYDEEWNESAALRDFVEYLRIIK